MAPTPQGLVASLAYSACSIGMVLLNKAVLSTFGYDHHMVLLLFQNSVTFGLVLIQAKLGYTKMPQFDKAKAKAWFPVNLLFLAMLFTSFGSLQHLAVPLVTIFKNLTNALTLAGDWFFFGRPSSRGVLLSLAIMATGAVLAGLNDINFDLVGYLWMAANCTSTAAYLLYMRYVMQTQVSMTKNEMAYYNSMLGIPVITVAAIAMGELPAAFYAPQMTDMAFVLAASISGCMGFAMQLCSLWCMSATNPTTYVMVGAFNKIPVAVLGIVLFDTPLTMKLAVFIAMGISGGLLFSYVKMRESQAAAAAKEAQEVEMKRKETEDVEVQKLLSAVDGGDDDDDMA